MFDYKLLVDDYFGTDKYKAVSLVHLNQFYFEPNYPVLKYTPTKTDNVECILITKFYYSNSTGSSQVELFNDNTSTRLLAFETINTDDLKTIDCLEIIRGNSFTLRIQLNGSKCNWGIQAVTFAKKLLK